MKKTETIEKLTKIRDADIRALCPILFERAAQHEDIQQALEGCPVIASPVERAVESLVACSDKLYRELLKEEIALLNKVSETLEDQAYADKYGIYQAFVPVVVNDEIQCCLRTGWMLTKPLHEDLLKRISETGCITDKELKKAVKSLRIYTDDEEEKITAFLRQLRGILEVALKQAARADELTDQLIDSERARSLGTLSGGVAHHFNSLLSVILGYSSFMLNRLSLPPEAADALEHISDAAQRGRRLTEEMLAFLGSDTEERTSCYVHEILEGVISLLHSQVHSRIRFEVNLAAESDEIVARQSEVHQVIFNLVTNTLDAIEGPGCLIVKTRNVGIDIEGKMQQHLEIEVGNQEDGEIRAAESVKESHDSAPLGLKLSSLYGLVGNLEGSVLVTPVAGGKTRVKVLLPTIGVLKTTVADAEANEQILPSNIWVVDDDETFREMCEFVLTGQGHTIYGISGAKKLKDEWGSDREKPDLIIMDYSMPEYNGLEMCLWLEKQKSQIPVILVSGLSASQPDILKAQKMKRTNFLQKPFTFRELADAVEMALGETLLTGK